MGAFISQSYPPKPQWSVANIPDLTGKVFLVTGGNTGLGKETIKALLINNAKVYLAARTRARAEAAIVDLERDTGKVPIFLELDLADLDSIKHAVDEFKKLESSLDVLMNNAAVMEPPKEQMTVNGYDLQFGTNALGHYYLTRLLLPTLISTATQSADKKARIITTSSLSHVLAPKVGIDYRLLKGDSEEVLREKRKLSGQSLYGMSKWANVVMSNELAKKYSDQGIIAISVNPGNLKTELQRHVTGPNPGLLMRIAGSLILYPSPLGALGQLWAGTTPEALKYNGQYVWPWARPGRAARPDTHDLEKSKKLMDWFDTELEGRL